jgi:hypothetical protein
VGLKIIPSTWKDLHRKHRGRRDCRQSNKKTSGGKLVYAIRKVRSRFIWTRTRSISGFVGNEVVNASSHLRMGNFEHHA